ncbi:hypothetical protein EOM82_05300, partial [bacterium]|nr:hypothetical protein [bacterium]
MSNKSERIALKHFIKEAAYYIARRNRPYKKTIKFDRCSAQIIAHRGLSGIEMENTMPAFQMAGEHNYYGIETDVHKTADGKYVIIHDDNTARVSGLNHIVEQTDFETLRKIKLKNRKGIISEKHNIPTLVEYVNVCKQFGKICVLELKNHFEEEEVYEIASIIEAEKYLDKTIFISFDLLNLISLRKKYPTQAAQYLTLSFPDTLIDALLKHNLDLDIYFRELTKSRVELLHSNNIKVNCWTVNSKRAATILAKWGVD